MKKIFNKQKYTILAITLVGITTFLLGGLFVQALHSASEETEKIQLTPLSPEKQHTTKQVYASSRGKRYYPWWCNAGNSIAEKNKVWYNTPAQAEKEGYQIAKGCQ